MVRFSVCLSALFAVASAAPSGYGPQAYGPHAYVGAPSVHEVVVPGPRHVQKIPISGVVGHETIQVGSKQVLAGHQYVHGGTSFEQPPTYSYPAGPPRSSARTVPVAPPAIPGPTQTFSAPAVEASVQTYRNDNAPGRRNIVITPQQTIVKPVVEVNEVPYDVPVHVPVPVEREVILEKVVAKPVPVEVLVRVPVAKPYKVHPIQTVVKTPIVHQQTYSHSYAHGPHAAGPYAAGSYAAGPYAAGPYAAGPYAAGPYAAGPHAYAQAAAPLKHAY